jgi:hypothetical protein
MGDPALIGHKQDRRNQKGGGGLAVGMSGQGSRGEDRRCQGQLSEAGHSASCGWLVEAAGTTTVIKQGKTMAVRQSVPSSHIALRASLDSTVVARGLLDACSTPFGAYSTAGEGECRRTGTMPRGGICDAHGARPRHHALLGL